MRTIGSNREATWLAIRKAGIELIYRHGFEAMNLRDLAHQAGLKGAGSLYNYFSSKDDFLFRIMCEIMEEILAELDKNLEAVQGVSERINAFVAFHIRWHTARRKETLISHAEMRSLSANHYKHYIGLRKKYEQFFMGLIVAGGHNGDFSVPDVHILTQSILSMLTSVCNWYHARGRISQQRLIVIHQQMVLAMLRSGKPPSTQ
ncbi:MAG: TetR/AcrR family transcriptional regulator [Burkholderiaceae bacterium]|jgi:AcrR family transcriptional regulator|nr:TetR/AcrR family transcriptional regulator [Burkholderiaceae bacterium]